jgi:membrane protein DedA with SNARE-associated domain
VGNVPPFADHFPYLGTFLLLILDEIGLPFPEYVTLMLYGFLIVQEVISPLHSLASAYALLLI